MSAERDDVDPGPELPEYPALPRAFDALVLDEVEAWTLEVEARDAELGFALAVARSAQRYDDVEAVLVRRAEFDRRRAHDVAWMAGWMAGRTSGAVGAEEAWLPEPVAPAGAYNEGWAAGLMTSALRLEELGRPAAAAARRSAAELLAKVAL